MRERLVSEQVSVLGVNVRVQEAGIVCEVDIPSIRCPLANTGLRIVSDVNPKQLHRARSQGAEIAANILDALLEGPRRLGMDLDTAALR